MSGHAVALDTNLLILLVVGRASTQYIRGHKRLSAYDTAAFIRLTDILSKADALVLTPNILSETSNLLGQSDDQKGRRITATFRALIDLAVERYATSRASAARPEFAWLGLSDAASIEMLDDKTVLLTDDHPLYVAALNAGRSAEIFSPERLNAG